GVKHPHQRCGFVDANLGTCEGVFASFQDKALKAADRFVTRIALDLHVPDGNMLPRRCRCLCESGREECKEGEEGGQCRGGKCAKGSGFRPAGWRAPRGARHVRAEDGVWVGTLRFALPTVHEKSNHRSRRPRECAPPVSTRSPFGS